MQETVQQYVSRILSYLEDQKPVDLLVSSPRKISALVKGATKRQMGKRPAPGKWSVTEILAHLADVEIVQGFRVRLMLASNGVPIQGFDQDTWAGEFGYAKQDPAASLKAYLVNRERNVRLMKSLTPEQWSRYGIHSERGKETVFRVAELMAGHDINHLRQIRSNLKGK
ncbi:MAG TPA: DinB family protein [Spirochaetia bacterium]|nr:DinB family protein [Spirochaetia bacterium]